MTSNDELLAAIKAFIARHDELVPAINSIFGFAAVHGYTWPAVDNWRDELDRLRGAVEAAEGSAE